MLRLFLEDDTDDLCYNDPPVLEIWKKSWKFSIPA